jgi:hypothetical protein
LAKLLYARKAVSIIFLFIAHSNQLSNKAFTVISSNPPLPGDIAQSNSLMDVIIHLF